MPTTVFVDPTLAQVVPAIVAACAGIDDAAINTAVASPA